MVEIDNQKTPLTNKRHLRAKLIFNPSAGAARSTPVEIVDVIHEMQSWKIVPETLLVEPGVDLPAAVKDALAKGVRLFVVCGGDGTITSVARSLAGTSATLGIIPIGSQNNTALSLGIPDDIPAAIAILRSGRRIKVDVGMITCGGKSVPFLEEVSVGLISNLFPSADDIQHGNLAQIGEFLKTLAATPPAEIYLTLDDGQKMHNLGYVVLVSNMPYIGSHYMVGSAASFKDGLLDVLFFADLSKLELLNYVFQGVGVENLEDDRIQHFHVRALDIRTRPAMEILADGILIGKGKLHLEVHRRVLGVMVGHPLSIEEKQSGINPGRK
jgi:diacylglycerol kinase family enzyme